MATDQEIRDAGLKYIPQQKYLQNPYELPVEGETAPVNQGIVNTNAFNNSGGNNTELFVIPPLDIRYSYAHPEGTGKPTSPFYSIWFIGIKKSLLKQTISNMEILNSSSSIDNNNNVRVVTDFEVLKNLDNGNSSTEGFGLSKRKGPKARKKRSANAAAAANFTMNNSEMTGGGGKFMINVEGSNNNNSSSSSSNNNGDISSQSKKGLSKEQVKAVNINLNLASKKRGANNNNNNNGGNKGKSNAKHRDEDGNRKKRRF